MIIPYRYKQYAHSRLATALSACGQLLSTYILIGGVGLAIMGISGGMNALGWLFAGLMLAGGFLLKFRWLDGWTDRIALRALLRKAAQR